MFGKRPERCWNFMPTCKGSKAGNGKNKKKRKWQHERELHRSDGSIH